MKENSALLNVNLSDLIRNSYSISAEFHRVREMQTHGTSREAMRHYVSEQLLKFVLEHIAGVKKTSFSYEFRDRDIYYAGVADPMRKSFERSATIGGQGSREHAEFIGWNSIVEQFNSGARQVLQISPPSRKPGFGDYGMAFLFERSAGERITTYALRYDSPRERHTLARSKQVGYAFGVPLVPHLQEQGYLARPVDVTRFGDTVYSKLSELGISLFDAESVEIEQLLGKDNKIRELTDDYINDLIAQDFYGAQQFLLEITERAQYIVEQYKFRKYGQKIFIPPIYYGTGCMTTGNEAYMPIYMAYTGEKRVTTCPGCGTRQLLNRSRVNDAGIRCVHCSSRVEKGTAAECIFDTSRPASSFEAQSLREAETCD